MNSQVQFSPSWSSFSDIQKALMSQTMFLHILGDISTSGSLLKPTVQAVSTGWMRQSSMRGLWRLSEMTEGVWWEQEEIIQFEYLVSLIISLQEPDIISCLLLCPSWIPRACWLCPKAPPPVRMRWPRAFPTTLMIVPPRAPAKKPSMRL